MTKLKLVAPIAAMALVLGFGTVSAFDDGTGGPEMATPSAESCQRALVTPEVFGEFEQPEGAVIATSIDTIAQADVDAREDADAEVTQEIDDTLQDLGSCLARYGKIGAYSFLQSDLALGELIYLGVGGASLDDATPEAEVASGTTMPAANLTPERVVVLDDGRIGAVLPAPQPGTEFALVTFVKIDELWMIESIAPIIAEGSTDDSGGGGGP